MAASPTGPALPGLLTNRINGVPVVDDTGELVGILCQSDLIIQQKNIPGVIEKLVARTL